MTGPRPPAHLHALTGIRGIAAWAVVLYHLRVSLTALLPAPVIGTLGRGYLAVDLFFILSGFVIWLNYAQRLQAGGDITVRQFLWRRFARVWPLHFAILMGFAALALLLTATGRDASDYPWRELPLNLLMIQNWGLTERLAWNDPAWSISTEWAAYLLFPAWLLAARWDRVPSVVLAGLAAAIAGALHVLFAALGHDSLGADIPRLGLWRCLAGFALGTILCQLWQRWQLQPRAQLFAMTALIIVAATGGALRLPETALVPALFFTALLVLALDRGLLAALLGHPVLRWLGDISYSTYLAHVLLFIVFKLAFVDASRQLGWGQLAAFLAALLALSAALYYGLEKPAQRWLGRRPPRWAASPRPLPAE